MESLLEEFDPVKTHQPRRTSDSLFDHPPVRHDASVSMLSSQMRSAQLESVHANDPLESSDLLSLSPNTQLTSPKIGSSEQTDERRNQMLSDLSRAEQPTWTDLAAKHSNGAAPRRPALSPPPRRLSGLMIPSTSPKADQFSPNFRASVSPPHSSFESAQSGTSPTSVGSFGGFIEAGTSTLTSAATAVVNSASNTLKGIPSLDEFEDWIAGPSSPPPKSPVSKKKPPKRNDSAPGYIPPSGAPGFRPSPKKLNTGDWTFSQSDDSVIKNVELRGKREGVKTVMNDDLVEGIRYALPPRLKLASSWTLLYSLDQHGTSMHTLYSKVEAGMKKAEGGCVLLIRDTEGHVFGGYSNEGFKRSENYYGNGECFLWKAEMFKPTDFRVGIAVKAYKWTGRNEYFVLSDDTFISLGGGEGKFGLWVDSDFEKGYTTICPCFNNEVLIPNATKSVSGNQEAKFEVLSVEIWAVG